MHVAVILAVCEGELSIAVDVINTFLAIARNGRHSITVHILDDASPSDVGGQLQRLFSDPSPKFAVKSQRLASGLGFRGCVARTVELLRCVADSVPPYQFVIKIDPDTMVVRHDIVDRLADLVDAAKGHGMWGYLHLMPWKYRIPLLADLLPIGFRRKVVGTQLRREWELNRWSPVWWSDIGRAAFADGFRFRFAGGGFYVVGGESIRMMRDRGYLSRTVQGKQGLVSSEEDLVTTIMCKAVGAPVLDLNQNGLAGQLSVSPTCAVAEMVQSGMFVLHPMRQNEIGQQLRMKAKQAIRSVNAVGETDA